MGSHRLIRHHYLIQVRVILCTVFGRRTEYAPSVFSYPLLLGYRFLSWLWIHFHNNRVNSVYDLNPISVSFGLPKLFKDVVTHKSFGDLSYPFGNSYFNTPLQA